MGRRSAHRHLRSKASICRRGEERPRRRCAGPRRGAGRVSALAPADLDALRAILTSTWLIRSSGAWSNARRLATFHPAGRRAGRRPSLSGAVRSRTLAGRLTLLRDGWRIEQICQYRPLIYYAAFDRPEILEQLAISVRSLIEFGRYQGPIVVLTDHSPEAWPGSCRRRTWRALRCCRSRPLTGPATWRRGTSSWTGRMHGNSSRCCMSIPTPCSTAM